MMGRCYVNVAAFCQRNGGEIQFGWIIWELPGIYLTAEHHAVVETERWNAAGHYSAAMQ